MSDDVESFLESRGKDLKGRASDAVDSLRSRLSILEDRKRCPDCSTPMQAGYTYDARVAAFYAETGGKRPSWNCPECGYAEGREESKVTVDPYS